MRGRGGRGAVVLAMALVVAGASCSSASSPTATTSSTSPASSSTTSTFPPPPAVLLHPLTPASDPALGALLKRCQTTRSTYCYSPGQLQTAYGLLPVYRSGVTGRGVTIGIVDSFGSPTIRQDLARFDQLFQLPPPPSFKIIQVAGHVSPYNPRGRDRLGWAFETTLDVEWAHAIAPGAAIVLAETPVDETEGVAGFPQIVASENYMIRHRMVDVISQSFAATEQTFPSKHSLLALRSAFVAAKRAGVTVVGASGDTGAAGLKLNTISTYPFRTAQWPATDPYVTAVGGLQMLLGASGEELEPPAAWNDSAIAHSAAASGGGLSAVFPRPAFQNALAHVVGDHRGIPDISMLAATSTPAATYVSFPGSGDGIAPASGTSLATPQFAGVVALADQLAGHSLGWINPSLYRLGDHEAPGLVDVVRGDTTVPVRGAPGGVVVGYKAVAGYDLATGFGTVNGADFVPELAGRALPRS